jgi:hypothetical protein
LHFSRGQDDVVGCGGFVRSKYLTNFSRVKVNLYTKAGAVKYRSECAPNNGYFLIPLYDKGEYVLKVEPPEGWSFEPSEVSLVVDGKTDQCSRGEDINFNHVGFSVYGQVLSSGSDSGPRGVSIAVVDTEDVSVGTETVEDGRFTVSGLPPGSYKVTASHSVWKMSQIAVTVAVVDDSSSVPAGLTVLGYDVTGRVQSAGSSVTGVQLLLYSHSTAQLDCISPASLPGASDQEQPHCMAESDKDGVFSFPALPPGQYTLVPHYRREQIVFEVHPPSLSLTVTNDSITVQPSFEVQGFTVSGRVLFSEQGSGVNKAQVFVNGHLAATTDQSGTYTLSNITTGSYHLLVEADKLEFTQVTASISPSDPYLPDLTPNKFQVCGHVTLSVVPPSWTSSSVRKVKVVSVEELQTSVSTDKGGKFCTMLPPGHYSFTPVVSAEERGWGLFFAPPSQDLTVQHSPTSSLAFSQFTASLTGTLSCIDTCPPGIPITLKSDSQQLSTTATPTSDEKSTFTFTSVLPGDVDASLNYPLWCWEAETVSVVITPDLTPTVEFVQMGYAMSYSASHDVTVLASLGNESHVEYSLKRGSGRECLTAPGLYTITPMSCHTFEMEKYGFDTTFPAALVLTSVAHLVSASVMSPSLSADITLTVRSLRLGSEEQELSASEVTELAQENTTQHLFHFSILAKPSDELEIVPQSSSLLFIPSHRLFTVSEVCPERVPLFEGSQGVILSGHVGPPPLEGVAITVVLEGGEEIRTTTDHQGQYRVGPIHGGRQYTVSAELSGYAFEARSGDTLSFTSLRLGHIKIKVEEAGSRSPLNSVLLSLSGSDGFRSNNFTKPDGGLEYRDLVPGDYFLKPLLREFEFTPPSASVKLEQGSVEEITFSGQRVAFGCSGKVTSLNGHPLEGVAVTVLGSGGSECSVTDETTTREDGQYNFRGLLPNCDYVLSVRAGDLSSVDHTVPATHSIKLDGKDLEGVNFVAVFAIRDVYISGNVLTDPKHFSTLQIQVYSERRMDSPLATSGVDSIGFFELSPLPNRTEEYHIIVDTNLPSHFYRFTRPELSVSGSEDTHITVTFIVEAIKYNEEHSHGSLVALAIAIIAIFAAVNFNKIYGLASGYVRRSNR